MYLVFLNAFIGGMESEVSVSEKTAKLSIRFLLSERFGYLKTNTQPLMKVCLVPVVLAFTLSLLQRLSESEVISGGVSVIASLRFAEGIVYAMLAVNIHRRYLLQESEYLELSAREWKFLGASVLAVIPFMAAALAVGMMDLGEATIIVVVLVFLVAGYVVFRWALIFPMIALEQKGGFWSYFAQSWGVLKGNVFGLFVATMVVIAVLAITQALTEFTLSQTMYDSLATIVVSAMVDAVVGTLSIVWTVTIVSVSFLSLVGVKNSQIDNP